MIFGLRRKSRHDWDAAYSVGNYDGATDEFQWGRYALIGQLIKQAKATSVLDIGCGHGVLRQFVSESCHYTGLDISTVAVAAAPVRAGDRFIACDIENWKPDSTFNAIVFSEVLYYLRDTCMTLAKMAEILNPGGMIIASVYQHPSSKANNCAFQDAIGFLSSGKFRLTLNCRLSAELPQPARWSIIAGMQL